MTSFSKTRFIQLGLSRCYLCGGMLREMVGGLSANPGGEASRWAERACLRNRLCNNIILMSAGDGFHPVVERFS